MSYAKARAGSHRGTGDSVNPDEYMNPGLLREIYLSRLTSGLSYQRAVSESMVQKLIKTWDTRFLDPIVVSYRDGKYYVIDGQHRVVAIRRMHPDEDVKVRCIVHTGLTYSDEAELFYKLDRCKKKLSYSQSVNALLQAGTDPELNDIARRMRTYGFQFATGAGTYGDNMVRATRAMVEAYRLLGPDPFSRMLALLRDTWQGEVDSLYSVMLSGMALFLKTYGSQINDKNFASRMSNVAPIAIVRKAEADYSTNRNALRGARVLLEFYNKGLRGGRKLDPHLLC